MLSFLSSQAEHMLPPLASSNTAPATTLKVRDVDTNPAAGAKPPNQPSGPQALGFRRCLPGLLGSPHALTRFEGERADTAVVKTAGMNKATREKLRRERLNDRFAELGALLDLTGANVDKLRVLSEAISQLKSLREEVRPPA
jgi:hypothetical protein